MSLCRDGTVTLAGPEKSHNSSPGLLTAEPGAAASMTLAGLGMLTFDQS